MSDIIFHFLTATFFKGNGTNAYQHYVDLVMGGKLIARHFRTGNDITWWTKSDPVRDKEFVFLTPNRDLGRSCLDAMLRHTKKKHRINEVILALAFKADSFRHKDGVFFRSKDLMIDGRVISRMEPFTYGRAPIPEEVAQEFTQPFTNQELNRESEILVHREIDIDRFCIGSIENDKLIAL